MAASKITLDELNALDAAGFTARVGTAYEESPWIASRAKAAADAAGAPFASLTALAAALAAAVADASAEERLALLNAYPDLAGKASVDGALTADSHAEHARAGLDRLSADEHTRFTAANAAYRAKVYVARRHMARGF